MYNTTTILWTTHQPEGLTIKDVEMANFCDEQASLHGELGGEEAERAGECCVPKPKGKTGTKAKAEGIE